MIADLDILDPWEELSDTYVTDGHRLWRVVSLPGRGMRTAVLEDCRTLELDTCRRGRLRRLKRLRLRRDDSPPAPTHRTLTMTAASIPS